MIRTTALLIALVSLWVTAFRDWMLALCGLLLLTFLVQNKNMPSFLAGIPGLNPWNVTLIIVTIAWVAQRQREGRPWNLSRGPVVIVVAYIAVIVLAYGHALLRAAAFPSWYQQDLARTLTADHLINPLKFMWAAFLLADGCTSPRRIRLALATVIGLGVLYGIMVIRVMPLGSLVGDDNVLRLRHRIDKQIGLHANTMAKVLTLTFWSILVTYALWVRHRWSRVAALVGYGVTFLAMVLCFSRGGYLTWVALGVMLGCVRWRRLVLIGPPALVIFVLMAPGVVERMAMGFDQQPPAMLPGTHSSDGTDWNEVTAGRTGSLWPPIIEEITKAPFLGHGRLAILHTAAYGKILASEGAVPRTPHNGFLEVAVDAGLVGLVVVLTVFVGVAALSFRLLRDSRNGLVLAVGAAGLVHSVGSLVNAVAGGILFVDQGMLGSLCMFAIVLRLSFNRGVLSDRSQTAAGPWWTQPRQEAPSCAASSG